MILSDWANSLGATILTRFRRSGSRWT
jgi:hypothetical protein